MDNLEINNLEFIHFDSPEIINKFIDFVKEHHTQNFEIGHKCCNGKGVGVLIRNINIDIKNIIDSFLELHIRNVELIDTIEDMCCICRDITNKALNCEKPHHLCVDCIIFIKNECPYCRRILN